MWHAVSSLFINNDNTWMSPRTVADFPAVPPSTQNWAQSLHLLPIPKILNPLWPCFPPTSSKGCSHQEHHWTPQDGAQSFCFDFNTSSQDTTLSCVWSFFSYKVGAQQGCWFYFHSLLWLPHSSHSFNLILTASRSGSPVQNSALNPRLTDDGKPTSPLQRDIR